MNRVLEPMHMRKSRPFPILVWLLFGLAIVAVLLNSFGIAIGQEAVEAVAEPTADEWASLITALGGAQGMGTLGLVGLGVQGLLLAFRSRFVNLTGPMKFLVVSGLTMVAGPVALVAGGMALPAALLHSGTLTAVQVFADQAKKQLIDKKKT